MADPLPVMPPSYRLPLRVRSLAFLSLVSMVAGACLPGAAYAIAPDELRELRETVMALGDRVAAQQRRLDAQDSALARSEAGERGAASALSSFLQQTDFDGWVAASYFWNVNNPRKPNADGNGPFSNPYHPDHNSFQFDEAWFVVDRPATEASPAGFHFEIVYGATASTIQDEDANFGGNDFWIPAANVSYRTQLGPTLTAGKFATPIGYEVEGARDNANITRGFTYNLFQPIAHTGALLTHELDSGFQYALGVVNGFGTEQPNSNNSVGALGRIGWSNDRASVLLNGFFTDELEGEGGQRWLADTVVELRPHDRVVLWLNGDYLNTRIDGENPWGVGLSVGARVAVRSGLHVAARAEYAHFDDEGVASFIDGLGASRPLDGDLWSLTGTIDYALTRELVARVEAKYEKGENDLGTSYKDGRAGSASDAIFLGSQLYYAF